MVKKVNRRDFVRGGAAAGLALTTASPATGRAPAVQTRKGVRPIVMGSDNGGVYRNGGKLTCVETAFSMIVKGEDVLDAIVAGVAIDELDPEEQYVGYGGLPNADGVVQLDASCMHGPKKRAGAVAGLEGVRTPAKVAKAVLDYTDHHLLVGDGAQSFARAMGFKIEDDLNTERSRKLWLEWKRRTDPSHYLDPKTRAELWGREIDRLVAAGKVHPLHRYGTINCNAVTAKGEIAGVTSTSGLAFKIPGRVGDSPILGAGLYVDNAVGAAGSTGRGEANLYALSSFVIVEEMRRGAHPKDAGLEALRRIKANTVEKRLLTERGNPNFGMLFYAVNAKGEHAGLSMYAEEGAGENVSKPKYVICTENGVEMLSCDALLEERLAPSS